jgi:predicted amidophosphoribosyltransferase
MVYYCTNCWSQIGKTEKVCPRCKANQDKLKQENFSKKLIRALNHPEPETPIRAAGILASLKVKEAIPYLLLKLKSENDPFIVEALVNALLILDPETMNELKNIIGDNPPVTVKKNWSIKCLKNKK